MSHNSLESQFIFENALLSSRISKTVDNQLSVHGISFTEYMIMFHLNAALLKTMRRIEIAQCVGISASGVTRLIAPMEKNGIVEKESNPRDARQSLVKLSKVGERLYDEASVSFEFCCKNLLKVFSSNQLEKLIQLSGRL